MIDLVPWAYGDLWVAERILSDPEMMEHLGGAQSREQVLDAHARYLDTARSDTGAMFTVVVRPDSEVVGNIGYWDKPWRDELVYETGWMIFPEYQGKGLASEALAEHQELDGIAKGNFAEVQGNVFFSPGHFELGLNGIERDFLG